MEYINQTGGYVKIIIILVIIIAVIICIYMITRCKDDECTNFVKYDSWTFSKESNNIISVNRKCKNKLFFMDKCSELSSDITNKNITMSAYSVSDYDTDEITISRTCTDSNNCNILPSGNTSKIINISPWMITNYNSNMITVSTSCINDNNCNLVPSKIKKNIAVEWDLVNDDVNNITVSALCNDEKYCSLLSTDSKNINLNVSPWTISRYGKNNITINRRCTDTSTCNLIIPTTEKSKTIQITPWIVSNYNTTNVTINTSCNDSAALCDLLPSNNLTRSINIGPWVVSNYNTNNVTINTSCNDSVSLCNLLPSNNLTKSISIAPWVVSNYNNNNVTIDTSCNDSVSLCNFLPSNNFTRTISIAPWVQTIDLSNNNFVYNATCNDSTINCNLLSGTSIRTTLRNVTLTLLNKLLLLRDPRTTVTNCSELNYNLIGCNYFQSGRISSGNTIDNAVLDFFANKTNSSTASDRYCGLVNVTAIPNNSSAVYLMIREYLTVLNNKAAKVSTVDANSLWRLGQDSQNKIYLNNVNYRNGSYFLYSNGDGTASLDTFNSDNVRNYGGFILENKFNAT